MKKTAVVLIVLGFFLSACGPVTPIARETVEWMGMQVPVDDWQVKEFPGALYQTGVMSHQVFGGCVAHFVNSDPVFTGGYEADWDATTTEKFNAAALDIVLVRVKDVSGNARDTFFDVYDLSGLSGHERTRLSYVVVDLGDSPSECIDAVRSVLLTIDPAKFPDLPVAQG